MSEGEGDEPMSDWIGDWWWRLPVIYLILWAMYRCQRWLDRTYPEGDGDAPTGAD
jgi:hypothetical protein